MVRELAPMRAGIGGLVREAVGTRDTRTPDERREAGRALRESVPLEAHADWEPSPSRPDPVELLKGQEATRVQELLPLRHKRMSASPFAFYRGAALVMAHDLHETPATGIEVQACGDAHISNFGLFSSPERRTVFDINDFDETARGPWEWDVKRLAASVEICGLARGFSKKERRAAVRACVRAYREGMESFASMGNLDVWYAHLDVDELLEQFSGKLSKKQRKAARRLVGKAKAKDNMRALAKFTEVVDGDLRIVSMPPTIVPIRELAEESDADEFLSAVGIERLVRFALARYRMSLPPERRALVQQYRGVDVAMKVVGVGSVGTRALIVVMEGADRNDPLVLQVKEAEESVLERFCGRSPYSEHGRRVVEGQRAMQTASDLLLGWCRWRGPDGRMRDYYVRQLWNGKGSIDLDAIDLEQLTGLARACGWTLAHAHARTGDRFEISGYLGSSADFDRAIARFARAYARQNQRDYERFVEALEMGEL